MKMKKLFIFMPIALLAFSVSILPARAEENQTVQKALNNAKQYLDDLVTAKDENSSDEIGLRAETFRKVLDLSSAEAKDFEFKLLTADKDPAVDVWKKQALDALTKALVFLDSEKQLVSDTKALSLEKIKTIAGDFKKWREAEYLPLTNQIQDFLLTKQEVKAVKTAETRLSKITSDLRNIKRSLGSAADDINVSLLKSKKLIGEAKDLNDKATTLFFRIYVDVLNASSSSEGKSDDSSATSTAAVAESATPKKISSSADTLASSTATSTAIGGAPSDLSIVSIKDLVRSSLAKIKEAYQGFIDISNLVRKLLK